MHKYPIYTNLTAKYNTNLIFYWMSNVVLLHSLVTSTILLDVLLIYQIIIIKLFLYYYCLILNY